MSTRSVQRRLGPAALAPLVAASLLVSSGSARADAIPDGPEDCPRGSTGTSSHTDTYCMPSSCTRDTDCTPPSGVGTPGELFCTADVGLCIESRTAMPGGRPVPGIVPSPITYDVAHASCATDADCAAPARCVVMSRCAPRSPASLVRGLFGCVVGGPRGPRAPAGTVVGLGVAVALIARRTSRRTRRRADDVP